MAGSGFTKARVVLCVAAGNEAAWRNNWPRTVAFQRTHLETAR